MPGHLDGSLAGFSTDPGVSGGSERITRQAGVDQIRSTRLLAVCGDVGPGVRELGEPGVGVFPGREEVRIGLDGSIAITRPFTGECDAVEGESGMRPLGE